MYLNAETQRNVLGHLHFALAPQGTLFLGHAEMLLSHSARFAPLNLKNPADPMGRLPAQDRRQHATQAAEMLLDDDGRRKLGGQVMQDDGQSVQPTRRRQQNHQLNRREAGMRNDGAPGEAGERAVSFPSDRVAPCVLVSSARRGRW